jgi:hypothetical protein
MAIDQLRRLYPRRRQQGRLPCRECTRTHPANHEQAYLSTGPRRCAYHGTPSISAKAYHMRFEWTSIASLFRGWSH